MSSQNVTAWGCPGCGAEDYDPTDWHPQGCAWCGFRPKDSDISCVAVEPIGASYRAVFDADGTRYDCVLNQHPLGGIVATILSGVDYFVCRVDPNLGMIQISGEPFVEVPHFIKLSGNLVTTVKHVQEIYDGSWG